MQDWMNDLHLDMRLVALATEAEASLQDTFAELDDLTAYQQWRVLKAFQEERIGEAHLYGSNGYGHDDIGRDALEAVYARVFCTEDALVRPQISCGTHAIRCALFGNLRPGDELLSPAGAPYDTLEEVIGIRPSAGSLAEYNVTYAQADLTPEGGFDYDAIRSRINERTKMVTIQRSRGYALRPSFTPKEIGELIRFIKGIRPDIICFVDNCYGEFTCPTEPTEEGADLIAGSLIKNPGGGLAPCGGYVAGKKQYVEQAAVCLNGPGLNKEVGASLQVLPSFYQGLFLAPSVVGAALKGAHFAAALFSGLGFDVSPKPGEAHADLIEAICFNEKEPLLTFCRAIQSASPVDSYVSPDPSPMPGYADPVIMAGGTFISGSSIELSADGPLRPPFAAFFQGGLTYPHAKIGLLQAAQALLDKGYVQLRN